MATIYTVLGTDSISSSRLHLNNNFDSINTELTSLSGLLNTASQNLTITGNVNAYNGTFTNNLNVTATTTLGGTLNVTGNVTTNGAISKSVTGPQTTLPTTNGSFNHHTYLMTNTGNLSLSLKNGVNGQEIWIVSDANAGNCVINQTSSNLFGYSSITLTALASVQLRYVNSGWYVVTVGSAGTTTLA
jgi:hypothetical protein